MLQLQYPVTKDGCNKYKGDNKMFTTIKKVLGYIKYLINARTNVKINFD